MGLLLFDAVPLDGLYKWDDLSPEALTELPRYEEGMNGEYFSSFANSF